MDASARRRASNRARAETRDDERVRARPIIPGQRVKITRRCHDRRMFLHPFGDRRKAHTAKQMVQFYGYTTARAVLKYKVLFHGAEQMGDHHHQDITDKLGNRPNYKNSVHTNLAKGINARLGRFDALWSPGGSCDTETQSDEETLYDLAYTDVNAVEAGLVKWGYLWPGFTTYGWRFGETRVFRRPDWYYDPKNRDNPPEVELTRVRPPGIFPNLSDDELSEKLMQLCRELEVDKQRRMREENRRFMGVKKLMKQQWWRKAVSTEERFTLKPTVASSDDERRAAALEALRLWREQYAKQREAFRQGLDPIFPYGTYMLRVIYNVRVAKPP